MVMAMTAAPVAEVMGDAAEIQNCGVPEPKSLSVF
jgi:hypothetical protein